MTQKYPRGLYYLFVTEMWERFSFYGISAVLILYLTKKLGLPIHEAGLASGAYMAFTFMTPILGGFVADKILGLRYSVTIGGVFILAGNVILACGEGLLYVFIGLTCVALGTGYLKSTVSVMVGKLYKEGDTHRDSGYTLFYMGINVGALLAGLLMGEVAIRYGWTRGFYLSSGGMLLGLIAFRLGYKHYNNEADGFQRENLFKRLLGVPNLAWIIAGTIGVGALMIYPFYHSQQTKITITFLSMAIVAGIFLMGLLCKEKKERNSIFAILIIIVAAICFQSYFKQMYNSVTLFVDCDFDRVLFGVPLAASFFGLVPNSLSVILLAGMFTWLWARLADKGKNPSIPMKIVLALCFAVASAALLAWVANGIALSGVKVSAWWIVLAIVILTFGELHILPMGLSAVSTLAPKRYASLLMGSWFLCNSLGGYFSGFLTSLVNVDKSRMQDVSYTASAYFGLYWKCAVGLAFVAVMMLGITPLVKKLVR
jgi:POT family proton-dependent oligopeptide transporter